LKKLSIYINWHIHTIGGNSDILTGMDSTMPNYPNYWHQDLKIYDSNNNMWLTTDISYSGNTRSNATITQIG
jgi:hypothetical protein